jgi:hypothetical protein
MFTAAARECRYFGQGREMKKKQFDIKELENTTKTLKVIAANYSKTSAEYKAICLAAKALMFACEQTAAEEFEIFLSEFGQKLTPKQKEHLRKMGTIKVDAKGNMRSTLKISSKK